MSEAVKQVEGSKDLYVVLKRRNDLSNDIFPILIKLTEERTLTRKATMILLPSRRCLRTIKMENW